MEFVDGTEAANIKAWTATHIRVAHNHSDDASAKKILAFEQFLSSGILPETESSHDRDFYRRTTEKMISIHLLPLSALDQFEV